MKRVFFGALAVVALMGGGCAGGGSSEGYDANGVPLSYVAAPMPQRDGSDPIRETQINFSQMFGYAQSNDCAAVKNYLSADIRAGVTDADCAAANSRVNTVSNMLSIDWDKAQVSADKKKVTLVQNDGTALGEYILGSDNVWYMNTRFWEAP